MAVTLKNIADAVGVHVSVVSRVLNDKDDEFQYTEKRKEEIRKTARKLGYVPNISARSVKSGNFGCVALLLSSYGERSYLPNRLLDSMHRELEKNGKHLLLTKLPDANGEDSSQTPVVLKTLMADGLIVDYTHHVSPGIISRIKNFVLPKVWINTKRDFNCVYPDNMKAGIEATDKLIKLGHKNIAYITDISYQPSKFNEHYSIFDRYDGYAYAMKKADLKPRKFNGDRKIVQKNLQEKYFTKILSNKNRPTAIVLYWSSLVPAVLSSARKLKINIPDELSIVTFAGCTTLNDGLCASAMIEPEREMGIESIKMLNRKIKMPDKRIQSLPLSFAYYDAGTCKRLLKYY